MIISDQLLFVAGENKVGCEVLIEAWVPRIPLCILMVPHVLSSEVSWIGAGLHTIWCQWYHPETGTLTRVPGEYHSTAILNCAFNLDECHFASSIA